MELINIAAEEAKNETNIWLCEVTNRDVSPYWPP